MQLADTIASCSLSLALASLQALSANPHFVPALLTALSCPHPTLRKPATGLLACMLYDGASLASSSGAAGERSLPPFAHSQTCFSGRRTSQQEHF